MSITLDDVVRIAIERCRERSMEILFETPAILKDIKEAGGWEHWEARNLERLKEQFMRETGQL
jgi:hypothetical protein